MDHNFAKLLSIIVICGLLLTVSVNITDAYLKVNNIKARELEIEKKEIMFKSQVILDTLTVPK